jgi:chromodomain-helicase-DNA-binding protein 1
MKQELVNIGDFIDSLSREEEDTTSLKDSFWGYVATFWPLDPSPPGGQLDGMYKRIVEKAKETTEEAAGAAGAGGPVTNGTSTPSTPAIKVERAAPA